MRERAQQQAQALNNEFQVKIKPHIDAVAKEKGIDILLDNQVALAVNKDFDISRDVIVKADEAERPQARRRGGAAKPGRRSGRAAAQAAPAPAPAPTPPPPVWPSPGDSAERRRSRVERAPPPPRAGARVSAIDIGRLIRQIPSQYPFVLVDRVLEHDPAGRLVAIKNVTGSEEFFEGHFPGAPVMPGVLLMESLAQAAGIWLLHDAPDPGAARGPRGRHRRRQVPPARRARRPAAPRGAVLHRRGALCRVRGEVRRASSAWRRPRCCCRSRDAAAARRGPHRARGRRGRAGAGRARRARTASSGPQVRLGARHRARLARRDRRRHDARRATTTSSRSARSGLAPQDLKYRGRAHARRDRRPQHRPRVRHRPPRHRGRRRGHAHRLRQPAHGLRPRGPRLQGGQPHDLRPTARRWPATWRCEDYATRRRLLRRAPVLPRRRARLRRAATRWRPRTCCPTRRRWATAPASTA